MYTEKVDGGHFCFRDDDQAARDELYDRDLTFSMELSSEEESEAYRQVEIVCATRDEA